VAEYVDVTFTCEYVTDAGGTIGKVIVPSGASAGTYLPTWNGHGDAMALYRIETDGSLTLANSYTYSTWGSPTTATHNGIADLGFRFLYVGAHDVQWDAELGLHYMHARHYSPTLGRFLQPDPSRLDAQLFVYAGNGPVSRVDPSGLAEPMEFLICALTLGARCYKVDYWNKWATGEAQGLFGKERSRRDRIGDAYKHCCWSAILRWEFGSAKAKILTDAHETWGIDGASWIDYHNNTVGRDVGAKVRAATGNERQARSRVLKDCFSRLPSRVVRNGRGEARLIYKA
jgi:RHS repeat-associated protein